MELMQNHSNQPYKDITCKKKKKKRVFCQQQVKCKTGHPIIVLTTSLNCEMTKFLRKLFFLQKIA